MSSPSTSRVKEAREAAAGSRILAHGLCQKATVEAVDSGELRAVCSHACARATVFVGACQGVGWAFKPRKPG